MADNLLEKANKIIEEQKQIIKGHEQLVCIYEEIIDFCKEYIDHSLIIIKNLAKNDIVTLKKIEELEKRIKGHEYQGLEFRQDLDKKKIIH